LAHRWRIGEGKVRGFILRGELIGVNVASDPSGKLQWRVTLESVARFERRRSSAPAPKPKRRQRPPATVDFYPD
jgi:hypothetical protein